MLSNICLFFVCIFSSVNSINFLGGFLTYQNTQETRTNSTFLRIQIRFQIENKHFHCTNNRIRLLDEPNYIQCFSNQSNKACRDFHQELSGHCQIENELNQYLIIERQFLLDVEYSKSISLFYKKCCLMNTTHEYFHLNLSIDMNSLRKNSSPYPYLPAAYYVAFNRSKSIPIFIFDVDGDEILCENFDQILNVVVNRKCEINYKIDRYGMQFGRFWVMDRFQNQILSRSLINLEIYVLENTLCSNPTELLLFTANQTTQQLYETIEILVELRPNCQLIKFEEQKIIEITSLCTRISSKNLTTLGIQVQFQCRLNLCGLKHFCFVGEMGFKLPSTNVHCVTINVTDSNLECTRAANAHDFGVTVFRSPSPSSSLPPLPPSTSSSKYWVLFAYAIFLLAGLIIYCGCAQMLRLYYRRSIPISIDTRRSTSVSIDGRRSMKLTEPLLPNNEDIPVKKQRKRSQYLRLGSVDNPKKKDYRLSFKDFNQ